MLTPLRRIWTTPALRLILAGLMLVGALNASIYPYQSLIAIDRIGMSDASFSWLLVTASVLAVASALTAGIMADQRANRRRIALLTAFLAVLGPLAMATAPNLATLILCHAVMLPLSSSLFGQFFALARLALQSEEASLRDPILASLRAGLSLSFVVVMVGWALAFSLGVSVMAVYFIALAAALALLTLIWRAWPRDGQTTWPDMRSGLSLGRALREIAEPRIAARLAILGAIASGPTLYMVLISLVFEASPNRNPSDVALFVGMVAGWEVPFMLALPLVTKHLRRRSLIALGGAIYASYLALMPYLAPSAVVWILPALAGLGGAAILTLPIAYLQDLLAARPGTASALMAVQKIVSDCCAALAFAGGMHFAGYGLAAIFGASIVGLGCILLLWADRNRPARAPL